MRSRVISALATGIVLAGGIFSVARTQNVFEGLVMPGPLIGGHAKLEGDCNKCHEPFSRHSQTRLCIACHKEIAEDRRLRARFHGRHQQAAKDECNHCHTDHKGRTADIIQLDRETFSHAATNFDLKGAHRTVRCDGCHLPAVKFRAAPTRCFACHKANDPHKGRLGEQCGDCHGEEDWRHTRPFDHAKTRFRLEGAHAAVGCPACHAGERYRDIGTACIECHAMQDVHAGRYGGKCQTCHDQNKWKPSHFDHNKSTKYPLRGLHAKVKCDDCHTGHLYNDKLSAACLPCHDKDDVHKGQLSRRCDHCHEEGGWRRKIVFDHDVTRFPLIGRHAIVPCEECHRSQKFKGAPHACVDCHKDQHHELRLGPNCEVCHNPNGWSRWRFNHDTQTKYPLTGAHRDLVCIACHTERNIAKIALAKECFACHSRDDAHHGSFGRACERCHTTSSFKQGFIRQ